MKDIHLVLCVLRPIKTHHQALQQGAVAAKTFLYFGTGAEGGGWEKNSQRLHVGKTTGQKKAELQQCYGSPFYCKLKTKKHYLV